MSKNKFTIVVLSGSFIEGSLRAQFGDILPIELPLKNKRLIKHQLKILKKYSDNIYVTIPEGYDLNLEDDVKILRTEKGLELISAIKIVSKEFADDERIMLYYGDSLFLYNEELDFGRDYYFVQKPVINYHWGEADHRGLVPAGCLIVSVGRLIYILNKSSTFEELNRLILQDDSIIKYSSFVWLDFGHVLTYYNSRSSFLEVRDFNEVHFKDGYIKKSSANNFKMWVEYNWLLQCKNMYPNFVPDVRNFDIISDKSSYLIEYKDLPTLSELFVFGRLPSCFFEDILFQLRDLIERLQALRPNVNLNVDRNFMLEKLLSRKYDILGTLCDILPAEEAYFHEKLNENIDYFSSCKVEYCVMHGDLCFSNVLYDFNKRNLLLIDPRGYMFEDEGFTLMGPRNYDIYKIAHSYIMGYDFIIAEAVSPKFFDSSEISKRFEVFNSVFNLDKVDLKMGLINLFLTMIPLHANSKSRQEGFFKIVRSIELL